MTERPSPRSLIDQVRPITVPFENHWPSAVFDPAESSIKRSAKVSVEALRPLNTLVGMQPAAEVNLSIGLHHKAPSCHSDGITKIGFTTLVELRTLPSNHLETDTLSVSLFHRHAPEPPDHSRTARRGQRSVGETRIIAVDE